MRPPAGAPFFHVDALPTTGLVELAGPEGHHAAAVRRMRVGEQVVLTDGRGGWASGEVSRLGRHDLSVQVQSSGCIPGPRLRVVLVQALAKGDHAELAVDLATQAGVDAIIPWSAERSVSRWSGYSDGMQPADRATKALKGAAKWRHIAREAAKQARRTWVPEVAELATTRQVIELIGSAAASLVLHEAESRPLAQVPLPEAGDLLLVVGPEGGLTDGEVAEFAAAGAFPVRLGPEVLRTSAAAAVALGALGVRTARWSPAG